MTSGSSLFEVVGGSVPGRAHVRSGRNNQDAFAWLEQDGGLVAVVCDGCGSAPRSELGAQLGARLLAEGLLRRLPLGEPAELLEDARGELCAALADLARSMGGSFAQTVADHFLFTVVGVAVGPEQACLFALGDGIATLNGEEHVLGPFPSNEPPYLGYALVDGAARGPRFEVLRSVARDEVSSVLLGTDGLNDLRTCADRLLPGHEDEVVGPLSQFWSNDFYYRNPDGVRRRLAMVNRPAAGGGLLPDDTTLICLRRRALTVWS